MKLKQAQEKCREMNNSTGDKYYNPYGVCEINGDAKVVYLPTQEVIAQ